MRIILAKVRGAPASRMVGDALLRDPAVQSRRMQNIPVVHANARATASRQENGRDAYSARARDKVA